WRITEAEAAADGREAFGVRIDNAMKSTNMPSSYALHQNYPNPFNPITTLKFDVPTAGPVELVIYDLLGREINRLVDRNLEPGYFEIKWDGNTDWGIPVATGLYFARMGAPGYVKTVKMLLLK
ncbi:MAG: T9SS type A sorting domain-containing protein, partial [Candidatus Marinimicrobia bacterium]|nr:T9SS type A sorting domain-containing protein [Candidatus Neomarinimicrobiota bacterium]